MELEEGELIEGIEANDVSTLLEQFLEYEEKQGSLDCSSSVRLLSSEEGTSDLHGISISTRITSFPETRNQSVILPPESENGGSSSLDIKELENSSSSESGANLQVYGDMDSKNKQKCLENYIEVSKHECKSRIDNHATDHNYACSGFPSRKLAPVVDVDTNGCSARNASSPSPRKCLSSDLEQQCEKTVVTEVELFHSRKRQSLDEEKNKKSRIPKRYRGPYCEDSSDNGSSYDEDSHYNRRRGSHREEQNQRRKRSRKETYGSSSEENCYKIKRRRHSLCSSISSDERNYISSDESDQNDQTSKYDSRPCKSSVSCHRYSSGSDRDSSRHHRRKQRSHSREHSRKNEDRKDKKYRDIELERKMGFKFDRNIKGAGKEERRIVYVGKISNKTTKDDVWRRFRPFGPIEKVTVHFRDDGDNYAFVTFFEYSSAAEAIERGNEDSSLPELDICFGGRRKFCGGSYVDFDSNTSYLEQGEVSRPPSADEMDFDALLRLSQKSLKQREESSYKGR